MNIRIIGLLYGFFLGVRLLGSEDGFVFRCLFLNFRVIEGI